MSEYRRPNVLLIMADDHAPAAFSTYGGKLNTTPNLDRIAAEGLRLDRCFCTNAICTPARASVHTGKYSHVTGIKTLNDVIDQTQETTVGMLLNDAGYQSAFVGKWHLGHGGHSDPAGYDFWSVLPGQGKYYDPELTEMGQRITESGYVTDILTDKALGWLSKRDTSAHSFLFARTKPPTIPSNPIPSTGISLRRTYTRACHFHDSHENRAAAASMATEQVALMHLKNHVPDPVPAGLSAEEQKAWNYQSFMRNYLRCVASIDENAGRLLDFLDENQLTDDTIVIYTSDHGFFLGDHGWYDKRFMYEESIRIPFLMRFPRAIQPGTVSDRIALNVDFAPTILDYAGAPVPQDMQGRSLRALAEGRAPTDWRTSMYYRYWMHLAHFNIPAHYGIRSGRHKLIHYYGEALGSAGAIDESTPPEWELFDLENDPQELVNIYHDPANAELIDELKSELERLQRELGDSPHEKES